MLKFLKSIVNTYKNVMMMEWWEAQTPQITFTNDGRTLNAGRWCSRWFVCCGLSRGFVNFQIYLSLLFYFLMSSFLSFCTVVKSGTKHVVQIVSLPVILKAVTWPVCVKFQRNFYSKSPNNETLVLSSYVPCAIISIFGFRLRLIDYSFKAASQFHHAIL